MTLQQLKENVEATLDLVRISDFTARMALAHHRYWQHSKDVRKDYDLRPGITSCVDNYYSLTTVLTIAEKVLQRATLHDYPIRSDTRMPTHVGPRIVHNTAEAIQWLDLNLGELEGRLVVAESQMVAGGDYQPKLLLLRMYWSNSKSIFTSLG